MNIVRVIPKDTTPTVHLPAANTAAVVTLAAAHAVRHLVRVVLWSYSGAPTGGRLTISVAGTIRTDIDIIEGGPGALPLELLTEAHAEVVVTLAAGGVGISGKLSVVSIPASGTQWER